MAKFRSFSISVALLAGCAGEGASPPLNPDIANLDAPVRTGSTSYTFQRAWSGWWAEIDFEFSNTTDRTISLLNCNGLYGVVLEKWQDETWIGVWSPVLPECLSPPIEILPGESRADAIYVFGGFPRSNTYPQFVVYPIDGVYRLVITYAYWGYDHGGPPWGGNAPHRQTGF